MRSTEQEMADGIIAILQPRPELVAFWKGLDEATSIIQTQPSPQSSPAEIVQMERWQCPDCGCKMAWPMPCASCNEARVCDGEMEEE